MRCATLATLGFVGTLAAMTGLGCGGDEFVTSAGNAGQDALAGAAAAASGGSDAAGPSAGGAQSSGGSGGDPAASGGLGGSAGDSIGSGGSAGSPGGSGPSGGSAGSGGDAGGAPSGGSGGEPIGGGGGEPRGGSGGRPAGGNGGGPTGGSGGGPTGGSGGGPTGGTGGVVGNENCLNGIDDNGDQLVDCNDPQCEQGYRCVATPPAGWLGIGWLSTDPMQDCSEDFPNPVLLFDEQQLEADDAQCDCFCHDPEGVMCHSVLYCYADNNCETELASMTVSSTCGPFAPGGVSGEVYATCSASSPFAMDGECAPAGATTVPGLFWPEVGHACLRDGGGSCDDASVCVPVAPDSVRGPCIAHEGDVGCPELYADRTVYFDGNTIDTRGCTACTCSAPSGSLCECGAYNQCEVQLQEADCNGVVIARIPADSQACIPLTMSDNSASSVLLVGATVSSSGQCEPSEPAPTGGVWPEGTVTVCCAP
jgi:hypothetical protein